VVKPILQFRGRFRFLSNFYISPFVWNGFCWITVEHAFQAAKVFSDLTSVFEVIRRAKTPTLAKKLGRTVKLRRDWEQIKISVMTELVWLKFEYNPTLRNMLVDTGSAKLVEGNYWHDNFWGNCFCKKCSTLEGKNILGSILMELRYWFLEV